MKRATLTGNGPPRQMSPLTQQRGLAKPVLSVVEGAGRGGDEGQSALQARVQPLSIPETDII